MQIPKEESIQDLRPSYALISMHFHFCLACLSPYCPETGREQIRAGVQPRQEAGYAEGYLVLLQRSADSCFRAFSTTLNSRDYWLSKQQSTCVLNFGTKLLPLRFIVCLFILFSDVLYLRGFPQHTLTHTRVAR